MKKNSKVVIFVLLFLLLFAQVAFAAWGSIREFSVPSGQKWIDMTTDNCRLSVQKTGSGKKFAVKATARTMWSSPQFRMVSASYSVLSDNATISATNTSFTANTTATANTVCYAQIRSALTQIGTDKISLQFNPDA